MNEKVHLESDIGCAAYLYAIGFELVDLVPVGSRYAFRFADPDSTIQAASKDYFRGGATAGAKQLVESLKHLKDLLYTEKKGNGNGQRERTHQ